MHRSGLTLLVNLLLLVLLPALAPAQDWARVGFSFPEPDCFRKTEAGWILEGVLLDFSRLSAKPSSLKELSFYVEGKRVAHYTDVKVKAGQVPFKLLLTNPVVGLLPFDLRADGYAYNDGTAFEPHRAAATTFDTDPKRLEPPLAELLRVRVDNRKDAVPELILVGHLPWLGQVRGEDDRDEYLGPAGLVEHRLDLNRGFNRVYISANQDSPGAQLELELELTPVVAEAPATFDLAKQTGMTFFLKAGQARITIHDPDRDVLVADLGGWKAEKKTPIPWDGKPTRPYKWVDEAGRVSGGRYEVRVGWKAPEWRSSENHPHIATGSVYGRAPLEVLNPSAPPRPKADKPPASLSPTLRLASVGLPLSEFNKYALHEEQLRHEHEAAMAFLQAEREQYRTSHLWLPTWLMLLVCLLAVLLVVKLLFAPARPPTAKPTGSPKSDHPEGGEDQ